jgi:hypothetical protein
MSTRRHIRCLVVLPWGLSNSSAALISQLGPWPCETKIVYQASVGSNLIVIRQPWCCVVDKPHLASTYQKLNEDVLVPPSDIASHQSHSSRSESAYASSDGTTESESSEEEGQAIKSLATDMMEQLVDDGQRSKKRNKKIKQKPRATDKQPTIGKPPVDDEKVGRKVVPVSEPVIKKPNELLVLDCETGNLVPAK